MLMGNDEKNIQHPDTNDPHIITPWMLDMKMLPHCQPAAYDVQFDFSEKGFPSILTLLLR